MYVNIEEMNFACTCQQRSKYEAVDSEYTRFLDVLELNNVDTRVDCQCDRRYTRKCLCDLDTHVDAYATVGNASVTSLAPPSMA